MSFQCAECTLTRAGQGPTCEECLANMPAPDYRDISAWYGEQVGLGYAPFPFDALGGGPRWAPIEISQFQRYSAAEMEAAAVDGLVEMLFSMEGETASGPPLTEAEVAEMERLWPPPDKIAVDTSLKVVLR